MPNLLNYNLDKKTKANLEIVSGFSRERIEVREKPVLLFFNDI